jgi:hypothetical protein
MNMPRRFDLLFEQVMNSLDSFTLDLSKFNFRKDDNGDIFCTFTTNRDGYQLNIIAKKIGGVLSFDVTNKDGDTQELPEKKFAAIYSLDYEDFRKALDKFTETKVNDEDSNKQDSDVKPFEVQVADDEVGKDEVKMTKMLTVDEQSFIFNMLNDPAVDNYCECTFQWQDEVTSEITYFKALLDIKMKNSLIVKIIEMDGDGVMQGVISGTDLETRIPELFKKLKAAIKKMEMIVWDR